MNFHTLISSKGFRTVAALARASEGVAGAGGGVARVTINEYVNGHPDRWPVPTAYTLLRLSRTLGVPEAEVLAAIEQSHQEWQLREGERLLKEDAERFRRQEAGGINADRFRDARGRRSRMSIETMAALEIEREKGRE